MRTDRRPVFATAAVIASGALVALLALSAADPVLAKEGLEARLDVPIARDTPGGTTILVGMTVMAPDDQGNLSHPVEGSPIYLKLIGPDGHSTGDMGTQDGKPGHYTMRIAVPAGGVADVEVGMHGTSDLPITVLDMSAAGDGVLVAGGITALTAQLAPALAPALTPFPRVASPAAGAAGAPSAGASAANPAGQATVDSGPAPLVAVVAVLALAIGGAGLLAVARTRQTRATNRLAAPPRARGA